MKTKICAALAVAAVAVTGALPAVAATEKTLKTATLTVKPSKAKAKFALVAKGSKVTLTLSVKGKKGYVVIARKKLSRSLPTGYTDLRLSADQAGAAYVKNGGQGLVSWAGPDDTVTTDGDYAEYFGWSTSKKTIELYGVDGR